MADVSYFLHSSLVENVTPQSRLITISHLLEAEVVIRLVLLVRRVVVLDDDVVATEIVAARVIYPDIVTSVDKAQAYRVFTVCQPREEAIAEAMLEDNNRPFGALTSATTNGVLLARNAVDGVDIVV